MDHPMYPRLENTLGLSNGTAPDLLYLLRLRRRSAGKPVGIGCSFTRVVLMKGVLC